MTDEPFRVDLTNCEREPIHIPGAVQPHGVLFACAGASLEISQVSASVAAHLGVSPEAVLGRPMASLLTAESGARLVAAASAESLREVNPVPVELPSGVAFDAVLHRPGGGSDVVVELEPRYEVGLGFHPRMRASVTRMQSTTDVLGLCQIAAEEVRAITGFDRVMIYRFDREWNGEVIAEARRADLETFLGHHYPASDIPAQARRLYSLNWLRLIADVRYVPSPLVPSLVPATGAPLDLSFSVLRSVSPIHIEYLTNMGVTASMSISLMREGQLWGLVACHHYSGPRTVPFTVRETSEYLGQALSWHVAVREAALLADRRRLAQVRESSLVEAMAVASDFVEGLATAVLPAVTEAAGAAVVFEGRVTCVGSTPDAPRVLALVKRLQQGADDDVMATDHLASLMPEAATWDDVAAGVLAVPIARAQGDYVLWFRPATDREVRWAGDPRKQVMVSDGVSRLSPRGSFELWCEQVHGRSKPWEDWQVEAASNLRRGILAGVTRRSAELRRLNEGLLAADRAKDDFIATVSHELRTPITAVLGWARMLRTGVLSEEKRVRALETVERNARAQVDLIEDVLDMSRIATGKLRLQVGPTEMVAVVEGAMETVRPAADARNVRLHAVLDPDASALYGDANRLQQIVWNLLSNAVKFTPKGGHVYVRLQRVHSSVDLVVTDTGEGIAREFLPHVFERFRQADASSTRMRGGLGLGLAIARHLAELHGGTIFAESDGLGHGSTFTLRLPVAPMRVPTPLPRTASAAEATGLECPPTLEGLKVLVVDDEEDVRDLVSSILEHCDADVLSASGAAEALALVTSARPDVVISDIGMPGEDGYVFIRKLRALPVESGGRTPAIALTAYARMEDRTRSLASGFNHHIAKPVDPRELIAVVSSVAGRFTPT